MRWLKKARYAATAKDEVTEAGAPVVPPQQRKQSSVLLRALVLAKSVNIWTDLKFVSGVVHGAIWKEQSLLTSQGAPVKQ